MSGIHGYRPSPVVNLPPLVNWLTPPEIFAVFGYLVIGWSVRLIEPPILLFVCLALCVISTIKYLQKVPKFWRPTVPTGPI